MMLKWIFISQGVNGDVNLNGGGKDSHDFVEDDSYPRLTISVVENDQQEDSCCEVFISHLKLIIILFLSSCPCSFRPQKYREKIIVNDNGF